MQNPTVPAAIGARVTNGAPRISRGPDGTRVTHRELLRAIPGSTAFAATSYSMNPGLASVFGWLWREASNYETYSAVGDFTVIFESRKSSATNGIVVLAIDFDASDSAPINLQQVMTYRGAVRSNVWNPCRFVAKAAEVNKLPNRYVRLGTVASTDIKTYDFGNLMVCTDGCADTSTIGEVYLEYSFLFKTPQSDPSGLYTSLSASVVAGGTVSKTAYLGTAAVVTGGVPVTALTNTLTFGQTGQFLVYLSIGGTGITNTPPTVTGSATSADLAGYVGYNAAATAGQISYRVNVLEVGQTLIVDWSAVTTTLTSATVRVATYAYALA